MKQIEESLITYIQDFGNQEAIEKFLDQAKLLIEFLEIKEENKQLACTIPPSRKALHLIISKRSMFFLDKKNGIAQARYVFPASRAKEFRQNPAFLKLEEDAFDYEENPPVLITFDILKFDFSEKFKNIWLETVKENSEAFTMASKRADHNPYFYKAIVDLKYRQHINYQHIKTVGDLRKFLKQEANNLLKSEELYEYIQVYKRHNTLVLKNHSKYQTEIQKRYSINEISCDIRKNINLNFIYLNAYDTASNGDKVDIDIENQAQKYHLSKLDFINTERKNLKYNLEKALQYGSNGKFKDFIDNFIQKSSNMKQQDIKNLQDATKKLHKNLILYGPPGTGKTYTLQTEYFPDFISKNKQVSEAERNTALVEPLEWWEVIALVLLDLEQAQVDKITAHALVKAKINNSFTPMNQAWITQKLYAHSVIKEKMKHFPSLFDRNEKGQWFVRTKNIEEEAPHLLEERKKLEQQTQSIAVEKNYKFVSFHQNFAYEDFIEGIKPVFGSANEGEIQYQIERGIFYQACLQAVRLAGYTSLTECIEDDPQRRSEKINDSAKYAIFIDEINRANVSSVFGELITLIESDKRLGAKNEVLDTVLPYSKKRFGVPANLHIIGTMNTADRSVEALDTALRRRFTFEKMFPKPELLENLEGVDLPKLLETVNRRIEVLLDSDHTIGHSYFINLQTFKDLKKTFEHKILPLLEEYFYGDFGKIGLILGKNFIQKKRQNRDIFTNFSHEDKEEFAEKILYETVDIDTLNLEDFMSIYDKVT